MSRELPPPRQDEEEPPPPEGSVRVTGPGPLVVLGLAGLFLGWFVRGQAIRMGHSTPVVSWLAIGATWFVAAAIGCTAYLTWRTVHRERQLLSPQQGVARLVLGKTIASLGSFATGAYLGSAISYLGVGSENAQHAIVRALLAGFGAGLALVAGLLLEHACRVPRPPE